MTDYRIQAYLNNSKNGSEKKDELKSDENKIIRKPVFEKIDTKKPVNFQNQISEEELKKEALIASKTGSWFQKKHYDSNDLQKAADDFKALGFIKTSSDEQAESGKESIYRRVAKFLVIIGIEEAAKILPHLSEEQTEKIIPEIATIKTVSKEESEKILKEFKSLIDEARKSGGVETAKYILEKAYGSEKAKELLDKSLKANVKRFEYLIDLSPERINVLIARENPSVQALVLSQLEPKKSAAVINNMEVSSKKDVILRLAKMKPVAPEVLDNLDKSLYEKMMTQNTENSTHIDGRSVLAQILKRMDPTSESNILTNLSEQDPELGADLKSRLFTEEDLLACDNRFLQNKLQDMDDKSIALLLKGKSEDYKNKIYSNVSKTRVSLIKEEELILGAVLKSDVEQISSQFFSMLRRAWEDGELKIEGRDDGEIYV